MAHFNREILSDDIKRLISENAGLAAETFMLKFGHRKDLPLTDMINQISGIQKAKGKLPLWASTEGIIFPARLSLQQCSSEMTAIYKSFIVDSAALLIDITGGFGVDSFYFSKCNASVIYIERDVTLSEIVKWNFLKLGANNIELINADGIDWLKRTTLKAPPENTVIYIDPARRDSLNNKVILLADCEPDVVRQLPLFFEKAHTILIKTSPLLDIESSIKDLKRVDEVHVVAVDNECKEVLYLLRKEADSNNVHLKTVNFIHGGGQQVFDFKKDNELHLQVSYSEPLSYLYEPNAAILKAGAFRIVAERYGVSKLAANTHIYTSDKYVDDFPGRHFRVTSVFKFKDKRIFEFLTDHKANITVRNFPYSVEEIKKIMKIKDGGGWFIFAVRDFENKPILILCTKKGADSDDTAG